MQSTSIQHNTHRRGLFVTIAACFGAAAQSQLPPAKHEEVVLPSGKKQSDEILKAEYKQNLEDARRLNTLTRTFQEELEKEDRFILSIATLKKLDDIEKLTKRIRARLKH